MSWIAVNFQLVKYSSVEGTHWFYDPVHPSTIQFLLDSQWQPWDVGWVKQRAQDPEIRRIAEDAETRLVHNPSFGYRPWPTHSPTTSTPQNSSLRVGVHPISHRVPQSPLKSDTSSSSKAGSSAHHRYNSLPQLSTSPISPLTAGSNQSLQSPASYNSPYSAQRSHLTTVAATPLTSTITAKPQQSHDPAALQQLNPPELAPREHHRGSIPPPTPPLEYSPSITGGSDPPEYPTREQPKSSSYSQTAIAYPPSSHISAHEASSAPINVSINRETKVLLSLDGDGIRGLTAALLVESLVNAVCSRLGRQLDPHQIFDLMGGVSTGGLLAIMIGRLRMRAHKAREAYLDIVKHVYNDKFEFFSSFAPDTNAPPHTQVDRGLEQSIKDMVISQDVNPEEKFFDERPGATKVFTISTKVEIGCNQAAAIIRSYPTRRMAGPEVDPDLSLWQAIHYTLAAPRYISNEGSRERRTIIEPGFVDYGASKNNPVRDLFYECRKLYSYGNDTMVIVSIGTGTGCDRLCEVTDMANSVEDRKAEAKFAGDKFEADMHDLRDRGWMKYFRFNVPDLFDVPLDESGQLDHLMMKTHAYLAQPEVSQQFYGCVEAIAATVVGDLKAWPRTAL
ncbi:FabD/lysophospholipase-like protein [Aaosphaeria arxii CBS 175.79]|uniref:FabD/lysophospholipase-like protein n=1 Tax=Aaosphaeria arxii CBS 175.79 TaxID=1450172 RepID=A0A6A5XHZ8_9PLEO|nr:FabD/lysophospholipase-like protein [Aaosphaeria arxii CBS 175.79]KAF2012583.1 FabD/lysophospholipase-like protein [Aaosphaeria arxii CBS 175.79]